MPAALKAPGPNVASLRRSASISKCLPFVEKAYRVRATYAQLAEWASTSEWTAKKVMQAYVADQEAENQIQAIDAQRRKPSSNSGTDLELGLLTTGKDKSNGKGICWDDICSMIEKQNENSPVALAEGLLALEMLRSSIDNLPKARTVADTDKLLLMIRRALGMTDASTQASPLINLQIVSGGDGPPVKVTGKEVKAKELPE